MADVHRILGSLPDGADQMASADGAPRRLLRHGRAWRVSLDAILAMPIPPHGLRWLSILSKPRFAPLQTAVCLSCHEGNCQQARQSSLLALAQACCERWHGVFPAITSILIHSSTYRLIYGLWFHPLPQPHRSRYWARGPRISLIIKWRRKPGDRLLLAVPRRRYDVR